MSVPAPGPGPETGRRGRPWWNLAGALTLLRVALVPVIAVLLLAGGEAARWWAFAIFVFAALTDSVDGWVARRVGVTRWGQVADPAADKVLIVGSLAVLAWLQWLPWWAVAVILARELAVTVQRAALLRRGRVMPASLSGKAKTVTQVVAVTLYLLPDVPGGVRLAALWLAVAVTVLSGLEYGLRGWRSLRAR